MRLPTARLAAGLSLFLALSLSLSTAGCAKLMGYTDAGKGEPIKQYPDGPDGLKALFEDILEAARKDDRQRVHDLMASTVMTDADLRALLPDAPTLQGRYTKLMETLVNRGSVELVVQVYERKLDAVEVIAIDPAAKDAGDADRALAKALATPIKWYSVRIKKAADQKGLRYDFYFYRNGKWLTGNQLGKFVPGYQPRDGGT
jgi:hypothetical protein